jgi:hypothetical protein
MKDHREWERVGFNVEAGPDVTYAVHARNTSAHTLRANARLIAAAPELLVALSNMMDLHGPQGEGRVWTDEDGDNWMSARRLLAAIQGADNG